VIEGDLETENDAERIRRHGVPAVQITTGMACHLDAHMVHAALHELPLKGVDILFIENVGNLVCPASFDIGQHANVLLLSVTEGDDKPAKYPVMVRAADQMLITKTDLLP
jgi:hydrogenase nickel incorporation protein HypB